MTIIKSSRSKLLFLILFFVCFGMANEVVFTAVVALFTGEVINGKPPLALAGTTYVWMAFIYALIPVLGYFFYDRVKHLPFYLRLPMYVVLLYAVEFISGYLLRLLTGACPWEYTGGWNVMGLIQLQYFPAWLFFVWLVERLYVYVNAHFIP